MTDLKVVIVVLRQPRMNNPNEMRSDPFWKFGSFGCTGCHASNLMNPKNVNRLENARLAFAQGGREGFKLVYLTPPITVIHHGFRCEARWTPAQWPFRYRSAPLLVNNDGDTEFPLLRDKIKDVNRTTWLGKLSSALRARRRPISEEIGREIATIYERSAVLGEPGLFASSYEEVLPVKPPRVDRDRRRTYESLLAAAVSRDIGGDSISSARHCGGCAMPHQE